MKKSTLLFSASTAALLGCLTLFNSGCGKKETAPGGTPANPSASQPVAQSASGIVSAEKTSFTEVTSQLDPGGNFFLYLGTAQWLEHLSAKVETWRTTFTAMPDLTPDNLANVNKAFDLVNHLIKDSGVEDITGMGMSSVEIEKGMFRNKMLLHHYPGTGTGFLWQLCGKAPHALDGLDLLPANTALACFYDMDVPLMWKVAQDEVANSGFPQAQDFLTKLPAQFEQQTKLKWDDVLNSLGGEAGFVLTLNESNTIPIPLPGAAALTIPEPGLLLVLKVNDDTLFNHIDQQLKKNPAVISVEQPGLKMRTMPIPLPFIGELRPTAASSGGFLFIASSDELVNDALAMKSGKLPGLKSTDEFKRLSKDIPDQGNQFTYMSESFGRILFQIQGQAIQGQLAKGGGVQSQWMNAFLHSRPTFAYCVGANTPQGCLTVGNTSQSYANLALLPAVAVPAMMSAIAIPNFVKARATSQRNACINNLRQIDAAKNQWALEQGKKTGDMPTKKDLLPYLRKWPVCPAGGTYLIGAVGEPPTCSVSGHKLP